MLETLIFSKNNKIPQTNIKILIGNWLLINNKNKTGKYKIFQSLITKDKKLQEFEYLKKIYNRVTKRLTPLLNRIHKKKYNQKEWQILIFYFLHNYIFLAYDKWKLIKKLKRKFNLSPVEIFSFPNNFFSAEDTKSFYDQLKTDLWDDWLFSQIIKYQKIEYYEKKIKTYKKFFNNSNNFKNLKLQKFFLKKNKDEYFLKSLELPRFLKVKLNLHLNKNITIYNNLKLKRNLDFWTERDLFKKINSKDKFEKFIYNTLPEVFPKSYLENFKLIENNLNLLNWPEKPKIIFTSYDHYFNDAFKIYTMKETFSGTKFFLLQHGHQGHNDLCGSFYEKKICDRYFTWGNKSKDKKVLPLFCSTNIGKTIKRNIKKNILLSYTEFPIKPWKQQAYPRVIDETNIYKNDIVNFINGLKQNLQDQIFLKSFHPHGNNFITKEIKKNFKNINHIITDKKKRGYEFSNNFNLSIETINSTGFIELLSMNIPVILITNKKFFIIKKEYEKYYNELIKSNIIFFDIKKASNFINQNINQLENWWFDKATQRKIKYFCNNLCRNENDKIKAFKKILKEIR